MNTNSFIPAIVGFTLSLSSWSSMAETNIKLLGEPAPAAAANRTIAINPDTRYVNVEGGQVVKFEVGARTFAWNFDGPDSIGSFDLNRVAPPGLLDHAVKAYVSPNPIYLGSLN